MKSEVQKYLYIDLISGITAMSSCFLAVVYFDSIKNLIPDLEPKKLEPYPEY
jgi:hypothetical protein